MAIITGTGLLSPYSCELSLKKPVPVSQIGSHLALPEDYKNNLVVVKENRILSPEDTICDQDTIFLFIAPMGG